MADILSQNQIDALLKGLHSGEVEVDEEESSSNKKIKEYDFRSPKKFTKEQLRTLDSLHENLSRILSSYFSGVLRVFCELSVLQIEEQRYYEYNNALPDNALIGIVDMKPDDDNLDDATVLVDMSSSIGFFMMDRLLGGTGERYEIDRDLTDIEVAIMENVFKKISSYISEAWSSYIDVKTEMRSVETNPRLVQVHSADEVVVIVSLDMKVKDLTGTLNICLPGIRLEQFMKTFKLKYAKTSKKQDAEKEADRRRSIKTSIDESDLEIKAILHNFELDLQDVLQLQINDVIPLEKKADSDIDLTICDVTWFKAEMGKTKSKKAVKISSLA